MRAAVKRFIGWLSLTGDDGRISFSKVVILICLFKATPWELAVPCIAAAFGAKTYLRYLSLKHGNHSSE